MKHEIISKIKNPYFNREEIKVTLIAEKNPTKKEIIEAIKSDESLTVIKKISSSFGKDKFDAEVVVYGDKDSKEKTETIGRKIKRKLAEEAKKAAESTPAQ